VTCRPLEGVLACIFRSLTGDNLIVEAQGDLDLHLGHECHMMDDTHPLLGKFG
jgi:hypothetical protein